MEYVVAASKLATSWLNVVLLTASCSSALSGSEGEVVGHREDLINDRLVSYFEVVEDTKSSQSERSIVDPETEFLRQ